MPNVVCPAQRMIHAFKAPPSTFWLSDACPLLEESIFPLVEEVMHDKASFDLCRQQFPEFAMACEKHFQQDVFPVQWNDGEPYYRIMPRERSLCTLVLMYMYH